MIPNEITSQMGNATTTSALPVLSNKTKRKYRRRGLSNLLKMGHCAPAVMQTLLDIEHIKKEWLVKLTAGLPGGIGNTGFECGGMTAPLIQLGLENGLTIKQDGLPVIIHAGHNYAEQFCKCNHSVLCKEILGNRRVPLPCIKAVRHAPELYKQISAEVSTGVISGETEEAFRQLYAHLSAHDFHCAHAVLKHMDDTVPVMQELLDGTSGFIGGTVFKGLTCSAFTAGLMAVGLKLGEIENSYLRVIRMLATMVAGGNALSDDINKFNRVVNSGNAMANWFKKEFGSTQCRQITQCNFSSADDVHQYIEKGTINTCKMIAEKVAKQAEAIIKQEGIPGTL